MSVRGADGLARVLRDDVPGAGGITAHQDRLFVDECRVGGRLMELDPISCATHVLVDDLAMEIGPDGFLYYPGMGRNGIWRIDPDAADARPEREGARDGCDHDAEAK